MIDLQPFIFLSTVKLYRFLPHSPTIVDRNLTDQMTDQIFTECLTGKGFWKIGNFPPARYDSSPENVSPRLTQKLRGTRYCKICEKFYRPGFYRLLPFFIVQKCIVVVATVKRQNGLETACTLSQYSITFKNVQL